MVIYDPLVCHGAGGKKGAAQLNEAADSISGELKIQMGGKHMTFSQRVAATRRRLRFAMLTDRRPLHDSFDKF